MIEKENKHTDLYSLTLEEGHAKDNSINRLTLKSVNLEMLTQLNFSKLSLSKDDTPITDILSKKGAPQQLVSSISS